MKTFKMVLGGELRGGVLSSITIGWLVMKVYKFEEEWLEKLGVNVVVKSIEERMLLELMVVFLVWYVNLGSLVVIGNKGMIGMLRKEKKRVCLFVIGSYGMIVMIGLLMRKGIYWGLLSEEGLWVYELYLGRIVLELLSLGVIVIYGLLRVYKEYIVVWKKVLVSLKNQ